MKPGDEVVFIHDGWLGFGLLTCIKTCETVTGSTTLYTVRRDEVDYVVTEDCINDTHSYRIEELCSRIRQKEVPTELVVPSTVEALKNVLY